MRQEIEAQLIESIRSGKYSERELINLHTNATARDSPAVAQAVIVQMRTDFSRAANRLFGAKEKEASALLEGVFRDLSATLDFTGNRLKNGVKAGSEMTSGKKYIDVYLSYKNSAGVRAYLGLVQDNAESELTAMVRYYETADNVSRDEQAFAMHDFDQAIAGYKVQLAKVLPAAA